MTGLTLDPIPDTDPNLIVAARRYLAGIPAITAILGPGSTVNYPITQTYTTWIFQWRAPVDIEGTGQVALVVSQSGGWSAPNYYNTMRFPTLQLEIMCDTDRTNDLEPVSPVLAYQKVLAAYQVIDPYLHLVDASPVMFDTLRVVKSSRLNEPTPIPVPGKDNMVNLIVRYGLML